MRANAWNQGLKREILKGLMQHSKFGMKLILKLFRLVFRSNDHDCDHLVGI